MRLGADLDTSRLAQRFGLRSEEVAFDRAAPAVWAVARGHQLDWHHFVEWLRDRHGWAPDVAELYAMALLGHTPVPRRSMIPPGRRQPQEIMTLPLEAGGGRLGVEVGWYDGLPDCSLTLFLDQGPWRPGRWLGRIPAPTLVRDLRPVLAGRLSAEVWTGETVRRTATALTPYFVVWQVERDACDRLFWWRFERKRTQEYDTLGPLRLTPADRASWRSRSYPFT
jgi:hypothetical protein